MANCNEKCIANAVKLVDSDQFKTNADHIRSMTDKELAGFITDIARHGNEFVYWYRSTNWLKQPYEEEA